MSFALLEESIDAMLPSWLSFPVKVRLWPATVFLESNSIDCWLYGGARGDQRKNCCPMRYYENRHLSFLVQAPSTFMQRTPHFLLINFLCGLISRTPPHQHFLCSLIFFHNPMAHVVFEEHMILWEFILISSFTAVLCPPLHQISCMWK